jgi:response regulator RpfG family c-di-GMP phosphodiesterase
LSFVPATELVRRAAVCLGGDAVGGVIVRHLRRRAFEVVEADATGLLARGALDPMALSLVIVDAMPARLTAAEFTRRYLARGGETAVIVVSDMTNEAGARTALDAGAAALLLYPFGLFELDSAIGQAMARLEIRESIRGAERAGRRGGRILDYELLPASWLHWGDARSPAGAGHGYRVARTAKAIATELSAFPDPDRWVLEFAARAHEIGRLAGPPAEPAVTAERGAAMLDRLGVDSRVGTAVRAMFERWDGRGRPAGLIAGAIPLPALVLGAADRIDHAATAPGEGATRLDAAVASAVVEAMADEAALGPAVCDAVSRARAAIEEAWIVASGCADH